MIVRQDEYWLDEPWEEVLFRLKESTQQVSFKAFYFFNTKHEDFHNEWLGEFKSNPDSFTLFRVTDRKNTSDFRVTGRLDNRLGRPVLHTKIYLHYLAIVGFIGLLLCTVSLSILLSDKFENHDPFILFVPSVAIVFYYGVSQLKDYRKTVALLNQIIKPDTPARARL